MSRERHHQQHHKVVKPEPLIGRTLIHPGRVLQGPPDAPGAASQSYQVGGTGGQSYSVRSLIRDHLRPTNTISPALLSVVAGEMESQTASTSAETLMSSGGHLIDLKPPIDHFPPTHMASDIPSRIRIEPEENHQDLKFMLPSHSPSPSSYPHSIADDRLMQLQPPTTLTTLGSLRSGVYNPEQPLHHPNLQFNSLVLSTESMTELGLSQDQLYSMANNQGLLHVNVNVPLPSTAGSISGGSSVQGSPMGNGGCRPFSCEDCGKAFQNNSALVKHKLIHSDERRYVCDLCHKAFKRQDHLTGHMNVHKAVKPFQCVKEGCDKSYCDGRSLRRHLEHGHNIKNPVVYSQKGMMYVRCDGEEFALPMHTSPAPRTGPDSATGSLDDSQDGRHRNSSGETNTSNSSSQEISPGGINSVGSNGSLPEKEKGPVECSQCGRCFKNIPALNGHMRLHSTVNRDRVAAMNSGGMFAQMPPSQPLLPSSQSHSHRGLQDIGLPDSMFLHSPYSGQHAVDFGPSGDLYSQNIGPPAHQSINMVQIDPGFEREHSDHALTLLSAAANLSQPVSPVSASVAQAEQSHGEDPLTSLDLCSPDLMPREVDEESIQKELEALSVDFPDLGSIDAATGVLQPPGDPHQLGQSDPGNVRRRHPTAPSGLTSMGSVRTHWDCPAVPPPPSVLRHRRKSKGKPENVCQLLKTLNSGMKGSQGIASTSSACAAGSLALSRSWSHAAGSGEGPPAKRVKSKSGSLAVQSSRNLRPKPPNLIIPAFPGNFNRFHSQLRSPRCWEGPISVEGSTGSGKTPPPYTPPPILSPMRHGSGLFWTIKKHIKNGLGLLTGQHSTEQELFSYWIEGGMPKSAPIVPPGRKMSLIDSSRSRRGSRGDGVSCLENQLAEPAFFGSLEVSHEESVLARKSLSEEAEKGDLPMTPGLGVLPALPPLEIVDEDSVPPETDLTPHINVGCSFQAEIEPWWTESPTQEELDRIPEKADLLFHPSTTDDIAPEQIRLYLKFACSSAVDGGGRNKELALHLLQLKQGRISDCVLTLMDTSAIDQALSEAKELEGYKYVDPSRWAEDEVHAFQTALLRYEKFFTDVSKEVGTRSVKECVNFYYTWKKVCVDDYRKLKRKRRAELIQRQNVARAGTALPEVGNYNLRSQNQVGNSEMLATEEASRLSPKDPIIVEEPASVQSNSERERELSEERSVMTSRSEYDSDRATPSATPPARKKTNKVKYASRVPGGIPDVNGEFPCRLCGKIFTKVKSRNAHMKSHAMKGER